MTALLHDDGTTQVVVGLLVPGFKFASFPKGTATINKKQVLYIHADVWKQLPPDIDLMFEQGKGAYRLRYDTAKKFATFIERSQRYWWPLHMADRLDHTGEVITSGRLVAHLSDIPNTGSPIRDLDQLNETVMRFMDLGSFVFDVETLGTDGHDGLHWQTNEVFWVSIAGPGEAWSIPCGHPNGPKQLSQKQVLKALEPLFFNPDLRKVGQNCFTGDTEFLTSEGVRQFQDMAGAVTEVWTQGGWEKAQIECYGKSVVRSIDLVPYNRSRSFIRHQVRATPGHRWLIQRLSKAKVWGKPYFATTDELLPRDRVVAEAPVVGPVDEQSDGFRHGLIFADGSLRSKQPSTSSHANTKHGGGFFHSIRLCGWKAQYAKCFDKVTYPPSAEGDPVCNSHWALLNYKELPPSDADPEYIRDFIAGWGALDGTYVNVSNPYSRIVQTIRADAAAWLEQHALVAGWWVTGRNSYMHTSKIGGKVRHTLLHSVTLTCQPDMAWTVRKVSPVAGIHKVYCAQVPVAESFTLAAGIYTGNCKFDLLTLRKYYGECPCPPYGDTMVAAHLLDENLKDKSLDKLVQAALGFSYEKLGRKGVENFPFKQAALYSYLDAKMTWLLWREQVPQLKAQRLRPVMDLEMEVLAVLLHMEGEGALINETAIHALDDKLRNDMDLLQEELDEYNGGPFKMSVPAQKIEFVYKKRHHPVTKRTAKTRQPSTDAAALSEFIEDPAIRAMLEYADVSKLHSTYVAGFIPLLYKGRLHTNFRQAGTTTGRLSCVSGDTELVTSRGTFRFDEYLPVEGDLVETHTGAWKPVLRKVYKGVDRMFRVCLANGAVLNCTLEHRILTPRGWVSVGRLTEGDWVLADVNFKGGSQRPPSGEGSLRDVLWPEQTNSYDFSAAGWNDVPQRGVYHQPQSFSREIQGRESTKVLAVQDGQQKPNDQQSWSPSSSVQGGYFRWAWLPSEEDKWKVCVYTSASDGEGAGVVQPSSAICSSSHRWGQDEQQFRQLGIGDKCGAPPSSCQAVRIAEISFMGSTGVWDIEVADDHSYRAQGFINHNSAQPNIQNIPRPDEDHAERGMLIRALFIAPPGHKLIVGDFKQIEMRVIAHFSQDAKLLENFRAGIDFHTATAAAILGKPIENVTKADRQLGKGIAFAVAYGAGPDKVAVTAGITSVKAKRVLAKHRKEFPAIYTMQADIIKRCRNTRPPHVTTALGRRRRLPTVFAGANDVRSRAERQAINAVCQGTAADIIKRAMVRLYEAITDTPHKLILSVHDELVLVSPDDRTEEGVGLMRDAMEGIDMLSVPLPVDISVVDSWDQAKG